MSEASGTKRAKKAWKPVGLIAGFVLAICVGGFFAGHAALHDADSVDACPSSEGTPTPMANVGINGLPSSFATAFSYGRGTRTLVSTFTAAPGPGTTLPTSALVTVLPLVTDDGTTLHAMRGSGDSATAVANRLRDSSTYQLTICISGHSTTSGSYTGQLVFPGATLAAKNTSTASALSGPSVTATFQSQLVPFVLYIGGPLIVGLGIVYTIGMIVRRAEPGVTLRQLCWLIWNNFWSANGIVAVIVSTGAVFTAWEAQCFRNPTWGSPWPDIAVSLVTFLAAAAGAATVPMALAKDKVSLPS